MVKRIGKNDPLPNQLHIGYHEALRLVGEDPLFSPINHVLNWAYAQSPDALGMIHLRDWHNKNDARQTAHLKCFGDHCLQNTEGAEFIFEIPTAYRDRRVEIINSPSLNDFIGTRLGEVLKPWRKQKIRVGIMGVWTEAKVSNLCYEISTRYPDFELAVCSALTAGSSRAQHFAALRNLERLYSVKVIDSVTEFVHYLGGEDFNFILKAKPNLVIEAPQVQLPAEAQSLIEYLFRDCSKAVFQPLDGGFSGNFVLGTRSWDADNREQAPHVLKVGSRSLMAQERAAFEGVELVLGNNAPRIVDFADYKEYGAIKYRYASMGGNKTKPFQKIYMGGTPLGEISRILDNVFVSQLGRLYAASRMESCNLLEHYGFSQKLRGNVDALVAAVHGANGDTASLEFFGRTIPNPAQFYDETLEGLKRNTQETRYFSEVHGDLNGANILIDDNRNTWIIDFFHTHYGHVIKDLIKLENDLQYIFTPIENEGQLKLAMEFTDSLLAVKDLATLPAFSSEIMKHPHLGRAAKTVRMLRRQYPLLLAGDTDPTQAMIGQLRYAVHTLSFEESGIWQKRWALYASSMLASAIKENLTSSIDLRIDWVPLPEERSGRLGLTFLPGRRDRGRDLDKDIQTLKAQKVENVIALVTHDELQNYGVAQLMEAYAKNGINAQQVSVVDGAPSSLKETNRLVRDIDESLRRGENTVVHCVGGLGRSGTLAATYLISLGLTASVAIQKVRDARSPRAIETERQRVFINKYEASPRRPDCLGFSVSAHGQKKAGLN